MNTGYESAVTRLAHPLAARVLGPLFFLPAVALATTTGRASLTLLLLSGGIFVTTAVLWATDGSGAWSRMLAWERDHPRQRIAVSRQLGPTPSNSGVRAAYVMIAAALGLVQLGLGSVGLIALLS
jgi:hypothetical protein